MNYQEMQVECARLAELNSAFVKVIAAVAGPNRKLVVTKASLDGLPVDCQVASEQRANGDIVFEVLAPRIIPMEGRLDQQ